MCVAQVIVVSGWEFTCGVEADFVQHPPEINEAPDLIVTTAQTSDVQHGPTSVRAGAFASFEIGQAAKGDARNEIANPALF